MAEKPERFKKIRSIGQGEFGETILVEDQANGNRLVIIKVPKAEREKDLLHEVINNAILYTHLKEMDHPNLVKYFDFDKYNDVYVMIMEYVDGKDLSHVMGDFRQKPPLDVNLAMRIAKDVCSGLVAAHSARLLHSDLKPANIMIRDSDGVAKICDFGVSRVLRTTSAVRFAGSLLYSAPEMLNNKASFPADIWALSVILYEMVTGVVPFAWTGDVGTFAAKVEREEPQPPKRLNPKVGDRLNSLILRGLQKDPEKRLKAKEMLTAIEACMSPESETPTLPPDTAIKTGANRTRQVVGGLSALAFLGAAVAYFRQAPVIEKMACDPCVLEAGNPTTLSWTTKGANKVSLERDTGPVSASLDLSGSFKDTPKQSTIYTLAATSRFGVTARSASITVKPVDITFSSTTGLLPMVSWKVSEPAARISLLYSPLSQAATVEAENLPVQGSRVCSQSGLYVLSVTVDGVKFAKSTFVMSRYTFPPASSGPLPSSVNVVGDLLFFESTSTTPPDVGLRNYQTSFTISFSKLAPNKWIWWQLKLKNDGILPAKTLSVVDVWYRKKPLLESYEEAYRGNAWNLTTPAAGQTLTYRGAWNGGSLGWLLKDSLLTSGRRSQDTFRVDLLSEAKKIAGGEFSIRANPLALPAKPPF